MTSTKIGLAIVAVVVLFWTVVALISQLKISTTETHYRCPKGTVLVQEHAFDAVCLVGVKPEVVQ